MTGDKKQEHLLSSEAGGAGARRGGSKFLSKILPGRRSAGGRKHQNVRFVNETRNSLLGGGGKDEEKKKKKKKGVLDAEALMEQQQKMASEAEGKLTLHQYSQTCLSGNPT